MFPLFFGPTIDTSFVRNLKKITNILSICFHIYNYYVNIIFGTLLNCMIFITSSKLIGFSWGI